MKMCRITFAIVCLTMLLNVASPNSVPGRLASRTILQLLESTVETTQAIAQSDNTQRSKTDTIVIDRTSIGSHLSLQEVQQLIGLHNKARAGVGVGPVTWSKKLAIYAQEWANHLASTNCKLQHRPPSGKWKREHGENLFMGTAGHYGVADAVASWEGEKEHYRGQTLNPSDWYDSGHYTQMVWKNTTQIGCAKVECKGNMIVVCNYDPPGNIMGQKPY
jgi:uncharacterized protein YkwD